MKRMVLWLLAVAVMGAVVARPARADRGVKDSGNFFSDQAEQKANATAERIYNLHRSQNVLIETYEAVPNGAALRDFARKRASEAVKNGLYVVIVRKGGQIGVLPDRDLQNLFTESVQSQLRGQLERDIRGGQPPYDQALVNAIDFIEKTFEGGERVPAGGAAAGSPRGGG